MDVVAGMKVIIFQRSMIATMKVKQDNHHVVLQELKKVFPETLRSLAILKSSDEMSEPCWNINLKYAPVDDVTEPFIILDSLIEEINEKVAALGFQAVNFKWMQVFLPASTKNVIQCNLTPRV